MIANDSVHFEIEKKSAFVFDSTPHVWHAVIFYGFWIVLSWETIQFTSMIGGAMKVRTVRQIKQQQRHQRQQGILANRINWSHCFMPL